MPSHSHRLCFAGTQAPVTVYKVTLRKPTLECIAKVVGRGWAADAEVSAHSALCQVPATRVVPLERPPTTLSCGRRVLFMRPLDQGFGKDNTFASFCRHAADLFDVSGWCVSLCLSVSLCASLCVTLCAYARLRASVRVAMSRVHRFGVQLPQALHAWHLERWVHCDIKPSNMGVDAAGGLFLFDLGLAMQLPQHEQPVRMGGPVGTHGYMAPEVEDPARGHAFSYAADVYSACASVLQLLRGLQKVLAQALGWCAARASMVLTCWRVQAAKARSSDARERAEPLPVAQLKRLKKLMKKGTQPQPADRPAPRAIANTIRGLAAAAASAKGIK